MEEAERQAQRNQATVDEFTRAIDGLRAQEISLEEFDDSLSAVLWSR